MSRPKSFLTLRKTATQGRATSISVSSVCSEMRAASSVPTAEPMSAHTAAAGDGVHKAREKHERQDDEIGDRRQLHKNDLFLQISAES